LKRRAEHLSQLIAAADARDRAAELRDRAAEARDAAAALRAEEYRRLEAVDEGQAAVDRVWAGGDRDSAAADRADLHDIEQDEAGDPTFEK
jgi:hypothetical protein